METQPHRSALALGSQFVAAEVRASIARAGVNAKTVAMESGIPTSTLYRRLNGESSFSVDELLAIAAVLGVEVRSFLPAREAVA